MFIEAHVVYGGQPTPHLFNTDNIVFIGPASDGRAIIKLTNGDMRTVAESYEAIRDLIYKSPAEPKERVVV